MSAPETSRHGDHDSVVESGGLLPLKASQQHRKWMVLVTKAGFVEDVAHEGVLRPDEKPHHDQFPRRPGTRSLVLVKGVAWLLVCMAVSNLIVHCKLMEISGVCVCVCACA